MLFLKSISDLRGLMRSRHLFSGDPVTLQIPELNPEDSITYENRINCLKSKKGWVASIKFGLIIMAVFSIILLNIPRYESNKFFITLPFILVIGGMACIMNRLITIVWTRVRLKSLIRQILNRIYSLERSYSESWLLE